MVYLLYARTAEASNFGAASVIGLMRGRWFRAAGSLRRSRSKTGFVLQEFLFLCQREAEQLVDDILAVVVRPGGQEVDVLRDGVLNVGLEQDKVDLAAPCSILNLLIGRFLSGRGCGLSGICFGPIQVPVKVLCTNQNSLPEPSVWRWGPSVRILYGSLPNPLWLP